MSKPVIYWHTDEVQEQVDKYKNRAKTGIPILGSIFTQITGGAVLGQLGMISASTGVGKSRILSTAAMDILKAGETVLYMAVEEQYEAIYERFNRNPDYDRKKMKLAVTDEPLLTNEEVESLILESKANYIIYDYLEFTENMTDTDAASFQTLRFRADALSRIAHKYNKFILTSTQLSRYSFKNDDVMDATCLAESKSISTKLDFGFIMRRVNENEINEATPANGVILQSYKLRHNENGDIGKRLYATFDRGLLQFEELYLTNAKGGTTK